MYVLETKQASRSAFVFNALSLSFLLFSQSVNEFQNFVGLIQISND
jgi:hypothetical protein